MTTRLTRYCINPLFLSATAVMLSGCAHAPSTPDPTPAKESAAMTTPPENPTLTAEEIGKRFLKLIEGLESRNDLSLERIRDVTGITLTLEPETLGAGYWSQDLGEGWRYALTYYPNSPSLLEGVGLSFWHSSEDRISNVMPVCVLDFNYYHNALVKMGLMAEQYYGEHGLLLDWRYTKFKKSDGTVDMTISIVQMAGNAPGHVCVKSIGTLNGR